jgi:hypothetical protein
MVADATDAATGAVPKLTKAGRVGGVAVTFHLL